MTDSPPQAPPRRRNKWLMLIATYKSLQALLIAAVGFGALRLVGKDIGDITGQIVSALRFNPESRLINFVLDQASLLNDPMLRRIGLVAFCYAGLSLAEGIGLYLEKAWGEFLTLFITASFLPWEVFEVSRRVTWVRIALLIVNTLVFVYLLKVVAVRRKQPEEGESA